MEVLKQLTTEEAILFPYVANPEVVHIKSGHLTELEGLQRLIMLDRYSFRDNRLETLKEGDTVIATVKEHPKYPKQGYGKVTKVTDNFVHISVEYPEDAGEIIRQRTSIIKPLETYWEQISYRVAKGVASVEVTEELRAHWFEKFYWMLSNFHNIPGGRILYGAGSGVDVTLFNCFVLPFIEDSRGGIIKHIGTATEIMSRGGGVGSNISTLRPTRATVYGVNGQSSGAISWANYLSQLTHLIIQGGSRRGAQMIGLSDWHPDILEFILCKIQNPFLLDKLTKEFKDPIIRAKAEEYLVRDENGKPIGVRDVNFMTGANISVLISDSFMDMVKNGGVWQLRFPNLDVMTAEQKAFYNENWHTIGDIEKWEALGMPVKVYHEIDAAEMWEFMNTAARYSAEPGLIFLERYNNEANSWYYSPIVVTNPCGEQGLPGWSVCNLNAINLDNMVVDGKINWALLKEVTIVSQRFGDNVIDHSFYFLPENEKMAKDERRIGKGVMGLANMLLALKVPYGSDESIQIINDVFEFIAVETYLYSSEIAAEKGSFPLFDAEKIVQSGYLKRMIAAHPEIGLAIGTKGLRNVCNLTVAPTGSTGSMVGVSTSGEPFYAFRYYRSGRLGQFIEVNVPIAEQYFKENPEATELPDYFVSAQDLSPKGHIKVQAAMQKWIDSSISKTANAPSTFTVEDNKELYEYAYETGCKGTTVYVDGSRDTQVLSVTAEENKFESEDEGKEEVVFMVPEIKLEDEQDLSGDTRVCSISYDDAGNMIKECS